MRTAAMALLDSADPPVLTWDDGMQPQPTRRARVVLYRGKSSRSYIPDADDDYRRELRQRWMVARLLGRPLRGDLLVAMIFWGRSERVDRIGRRRHLDRPDADNLAKAIMDAGNEHLWDDDAQVRTPLAHIEEWSPKARPRIWLEVWRWPRARR